MTVRKIATLSALLVPLTFAGWGSSAQAAILPFTGSATAAASVAPAASCAPFTFRGIITPANSSGSSNLGAFTYSHNACTQGAISPVSLQDGSVAIDFGYGAISGRFTGTSTPRAGVAGLFDQIFSYTILAGTGQFARATGTFGNIGTVDTRNAPPSRLTFNFNGLIDAPAAVPEPETWALMLGGFFLLGSALRSRNARVNRALGVARA